MKINELHQPKNDNLDEGVLSSVKNFFKQEKPNVHKIAFEYFIKDFVDDAVASLENGIKYGWINPDLKDKDTVTRTYTQATGKPSLVPNRTVSSINSYIKNAASAINKSLSTEQKLSLVKELVNFMADRKGTPEWENALSTVINVIKSSKLDSLPTAIANVKSGKTMTESWQLRFIDTLLEEVGLTYTDLGLVVIKENAKLYIAETKYLKLNNIFESVLEAIDSGAISINDYMTSWFDKYMQGIDWRSKENIVKPILMSIQDSYKTDKGRKAIEKLGSIAFDMAGPVVPAGARDIPTTPRTSPTSSIKTADQLRQAEENLKNTDYSEYLRYKRGA